MLCRIFFDEAICAGRHLLTPALKPFAQILKKVPGERKNIDSPNDKVPLFHLNLIVPLGCQSGALNRYSKATFYQLKPR